MLLGAIFIVVVRFAEGAYHNQQPQSQHSYPYDARQNNQYPVKAYQTPYPQQQQQQQQNYQNTYGRQYQPPASPSHAPHPHTSQQHYPQQQLQHPNQHSHQMQEHHQQCDIPPDLWCDSAHAAKQCGVHAQCEALRNRRTPLKISLVFEALCPYCQKFIANQLGTVFNQFRGQFELELIPWGNARIMRDGSFSCNHGKKECDANKFMSCTLDVLQVKGSLPFIVCFERSLSHSPVEVAIQQCQAFIRQQYRQIRHCYDGQRGIQLQREAAHKTMSTKPHPIMEVPYILVNDYSPSIDNNNLNVMLLPQLLNKWTKMYGR